MKMLLLNCCLGMPACSFLSFSRYGERWYNSFDGGICNLHRKHACAYAATVKLYPFRPINAAIFPISYGGP